VLTERGRRALAGIEQADSVTMDPHKWLYQPYECGCVLVRDGRLLRTAFQISPDYLGDAGGELAEVNFADQGLQLARGARALKVWLSVKAFGVDAFRAAVDSALDLAAEAEARIRASSALELLAPVPLGVVCFRRRFEGVDDPDTVDRLNRQLVAALEASGEGVVSTTSLRGRYAIRMCVLNHTTKRADVMRVLDWFEAAWVADVREARPERDDRELIEADRGWLAPPGTIDEALARTPLLRSLREEQLARVTATAQQRTAEPGETIVAQWDSSREFYLILDGAVEVRVDGEKVRDLGPGDFFGEIAALDWGASFGYPRLASVTATSRAWLAALPAPTLNELVREAPGVDRQIRRALHRRLLQS
jgi:hypothetical protein